MTWEPEMNSETVLRKDELFLRNLNACLKALLHNLLLTFYLLLLTFQSSHTCIILDSTNKR